MTGFENVFEENFLKVSDKKKNGSPNRDQPRDAASGRRSLKEAIRPGE
jgi:hypothetical protein